MRALSGHIVQRYLGTVLCRDIKVSNMVWLGFVRGPGSRAPTTFTGGITVCDRRHDIVTPASAFCSGATVRAISSVASTRCCRGGLPRHSLIATVLPVPCD